MRAWKLYVGVVTAIVGTIVIATVPWKGSVVVMGADVQLRLLLAGGLFLAGVVLFFRAARPDNHTPVPQMGCDDAIEFIRDKTVFGPHFPEAGIENYLSMAMRKGLITVSGQRGPGQRHEILPVEEVESLRIERPGGYDGRLVDKDKGFFFGEHHFYEPYFIKRELAKLFGRRKFWQTKRKRKDRAERIAATLRG